MSAPTYRPWMKRAKVLLRIARNSERFRKLQSAQPVTSKRLIMTDDRESLEYLQRTKKSSIAFRRIPGKDPGVVFLPGFMSNMTGQKAVALEAYCRRRGNAFVRFDYQGLGESVGDLVSRELMFEVWKSDAMAVLDELTVGPQILVGSSMGGAIMLLLAMERPERIHALVGIATAVQLDVRNPCTDTRSKAHESHSPTLSEPSSSYVTPQDFLDKQYQRYLLQESVPIRQPVRLIHGMRDDVVHYQTSVDLAGRLDSSNVDVILRKEGGHRMSEAVDIKLIVNTVEELLNF